jgi:uncharacterized metal-binding protein
MKENVLPLVYACSGCSNVAQLANDTALALDQKQVAQMSCIAGVGGDVKPLVKLAKSGRQIIALDGCNLQCVHHCLKKYDIDSTLHYILTDEGFKKRNYSVSSSETIDDMCQIVIGDLANKVAY